MWSFWKPTVTSYFGEKFHLEHLAWVQCLSLSQSVSLSFYHCLISDSSRTWKDWRLAFLAHNSAMWVEWEGLEADLKTYLLGFPSPTQLLSWNFKADIFLFSGPGLRSCQTTPSFALSSQSLTKQMIKVQEEREGRNAKSKYCCLATRGLGGQSMSSVGLWQVTWSSSFVTGRPRENQYCRERTQGQENRLGATYGAGLYGAHYRHDLMSFSQQHCEGGEKSPLFHRGGDQARGGCILGPKS